MAFISGLAPLADAPTATANEGRRIALVIGNGAYQHVPTLPNPTRDARAIANALEGLRFEVITALDLSLADMRGVIRDFARGSRSAEIALVFYAGHAVQVDGRNYLLPTAADIQEPRDLVYETIPLDMITEELKAGGPKLNMLLLDACRDDPLSERFKARSRSLETQSGLAQTQGAAGMLIAYATAPDQVALDGEGLHSPFTQALLEWIDQPGIEVGRVFRRVRERVMELTDGAQVPWVEEAVLGEFYLNGESGAETETVQTPEGLFWQSVQNIEQPSERLAALQRYLVVFPEGAYVEDARRLRRTLMANLSAQKQAASDNDLFSIQKLKLTPRPAETDVAAVQPGADGAGNALQSVPRSETLGDDPLSLCRRVADDPLGNAWLEGRWLMSRRYPPSPGFQRLNADLAIEICNQSLESLGSDPDVEALLGRALLAAGRSAEALRYLHPAADEGHPIARFALGTVYRDGLRGTPDLDEAFELFKAAADGNHIGAAFELGLMYRDGIGVNADPLLSIALLRRAASGGYEWAQYELGSYYFRGGHSGKVDVEQAAIFWQQAAEQGHAASAQALGMIFKEGNGVTANFNAASKWLRLAMVQGYKEAQRPLAETLLLIGGGVESETEAIRLLEQAASRNDREAALMLGQLHAGYRTSANDPVIAAYWLAKAHQIDGNDDEATSAFAQLPLEAVIEAVQRALSDVGYDPGSFNGKLSQETVDAIGLFRSDTGMVATDDVSIDLLGKLILAQRG
ncbi:MAG: caspase family protein [Geminicoccaceae bacterium]